MNVATLRDASEEIGAVEQLLENIGETGNERADDFLRIARARLGHANGRLVAAITEATPPYSRAFPETECDAISRRITAG